jgi:hypothetical protein
MPVKSISFILIMGALITAGCNNPEPGKEKKGDTAFAKGSFGYDLRFLQSHDAAIVLSDSSGQARIIVSPRYQGKVFTSTASGEEGQSFGWINYKAFDTTPNAHMNAYGGENRIWLGPEGGKYSLFFPKGAKMDFEHWKTPAAFDTEAWELVSQTARQVGMQKTMKLDNYAGSSLQVHAERHISLLPRATIFSVLGLQPDDSVKTVGYETRNSISNAGSFAWNEKTGMPCIWMLDMFNCSERTVIVIPYRRASDSSSKIATTNYFGEIPADRLKHVNGILYFKADGRSRGKLGLDPSRATRFIGSYDASHHILTIAHFDLDTTARYLNQEWNTLRPPFSGDAVNAYNDGPLADGSQMGPFYEIESVSPAALLKPGEALTHQHEVFHFTGPESSLDKIAEAVFHVSLEQIKSAF